MKLIITDLAPFSIHVDTEAALRKTAVSDEVLTELNHADVWVFACPLYVDGIPSHLLSCLMQLQKAGEPPKKQLSTEL